MGCSTNNTSAPHNNSCNRPGTKNWTGSDTLLAPRSSSGPKPHYGPHFVDLTEACTFCSSTTNSNDQSYASNHYWPSLCPCWRLRRSQPNPTAQSSCLLLNRPPWLNNTYPSIFTTPQPPCTSDIFYYNLFSFPHLQSKQGHYC